MPTRRRRLAPPPPTPRQQADAMDAMHEKGIKAFPAKTAGKGNQLMAPRIEDGVKVYELTAEEIAVGGRAGPDGEGVGVQRPGAGPADPGARGRPRAGHADQQARRIHRDPFPRPRAAERSGRRAVHHPAAGEAGRDATPTSSPCRTPGSHMYHSHHNAAKQVGNGLLGAFIVEPKRPRRRRRRRTWTT